MSRSDGRVRSDARSDEQLAVTASRLYFLDNKSKMEVAAQLGLSRFKVARLLNFARDRGIVRISISEPPKLDVSLADRLRDAYGLSRVIVQRVDDRDEAVLRVQLGFETAQLLTATVGREDVLGIGWARSVLAMADHLTVLPRCGVVQLTGAINRPGPEPSAIEVVQQIARISGGQASYFYAPMLTSDAKAALVMRSQTHLAEAISRFREVTKAVVGIGGWRPPASVLYDVMTPADRAAVLIRGACADVSGVLLDANGRAVNTPVSNRIIGISAQELAAIPDVTAIAYGTSKVAAASAALRGGFITNLVTHSSFAQELLKHVA